MASNVYAPDAEKRGDIAWKMRAILLAVVITLLAYSVALTFTGAL